MPAACRPKKIGRKKCSSKMRCAEIGANPDRTCKMVRSPAQRPPRFSELLRRRFPTSFVTTHGACRPRTPISLVLPTSGTLPSSSPRKSRLPLCSTACASSVEVLLTALHHRLLDALRATLWPASPPHVAAVPRAHRSRPSPQWAPCACASPVRGAPAVAASACGRPRACD